MSNLQDQFDDAYDKLEDVKVDIVEGLEGELKTYITRKGVIKELVTLHKRIDKIEKAIADLYKFSWGSFFAEVGFAFAFSTVVGSIVNGIAYRATRRKLNKTFKNFDPKNLYIQHDTGWGFRFVNGKYDVVPNTNRGNLEFIMENVNGLVDYAKSTLITTEAIKKSALDSFHSLVFVIGQEIMKDHKNYDYKNSNPLMWLTSLQSIETFLDNQTKLFWNTLLKIVKEQNNLVLAQKLEEPLREIRRLMQLEGKMDQRNPDNYKVKYSNYIDKIVNRYIKYGMFVGLPIGIGEVKFLYINGNAKKSSARPDKSLLSTMEETGYIPSGSKYLILDELANSFRDFLVQSGEISRAGLREDGTLWVNFKFDCVLCLLKDKKKLKIAIRLTEYCFYAPLENRKKWVPIPDDKTLKEKKYKLKKYFPIKNYPIQRTQLPVTKFFRDEFLKKMKYDTSQDVLLNLLKFKTKHIANGRIPAIESTDNYVASWPFI